MCGDFHSGKDCGSLEGPFGTRTRNPSATVLAKPMRVKGTFLEEDLGKVEPDSRQSVLVF